MHSSSLFLVPTELHRLSGGMDSERAGNFFEEMIIKEEPLEAGETEKEGFGEMEGDSGEMEREGASDFFEEMVIKEEPVEAGEMTGFYLYFYAPFSVLGLSLPSPVSTKFATWETF